jgi:hypothetical protein
MQHSMPLTKSTNLPSIKHSIYVSRQSSHLAKPWSYTSQYGQKKKKPLKSKSLKPFATTSTILNTISQSHHTNQVRARKKRPQNIIQNENANKKTTNIKTNSKHISRLIAKTLKKNLEKIEQTCLNRVATQENNGSRIGCPHNINHQSKK